MEPSTPNSDDFVFDNQMLAQIFWRGFTIGEVILMRLQVEPIISTGLQPGGRKRTVNPAASAALFHWEKPLGVVNK